jgi:transposase
MPTIPNELVTMSAKEIDRLTVIQRVQERCLSQKKAADMLGVSTRQMRRLAKSYGQDGARGLVSKRRGRRANNAMESEFRQRVMALVAERYSDFGPTLATEKLAELHGLRVSRETLRKWMIASRFWMSRRDRASRSVLPRWCWRWPDAISPMWVSMGVQNAPRRHRTWPVPMLGLPVSRMS